MKNSTLNILAKPYLWRDETWIYERGLGVVIVLSLVSFTSHCLQFCRKPAEQPSSGCMNGVLRTRMVKKIRRCTKIICGSLPLVGSTTLLLFYGVVVLYLVREGKIKDTEHIGYLTGYAQVVIITFGFIATIHQIHIGSVRSKEDKILADRKHVAKLTGKLISDKFVQHCVKTLSYSVYDGFNMYNVAKTFSPHVVYSDKESELITAVEHTVVYICALGTFQGTSFEFVTYFTQLFDPAEQRRSVEQIAALYFIWEYLYRWHKFLAPKFACLISLAETPPHNNLSEWHRFLKDAEIRCDACVKYFDSVNSSDVDAFERRLMRYLKKNFPEPTLVSGERRRSTRKRSRRLHREH